jgi:CCR4-NOT transcription complex subunit 7/8
MAMYSQSVLVRAPPPPPPPCRFVPRPCYVMARPLLVFMPSGALLKAAVRDVWASNFDEELSNLSAVLPRYPCVCVDTEFPGAVHDSDMPRPAVHARPARELRAGEA